MMTIKQHGGIFGRNPTLNDLTVEGSVTQEGTVETTGATTLNGGLTVQGNSGASALNKITLKDTDTTVVAGQLAGRIDFETSDASNPGVSARIDAEYVTGTGLTELVFYANRASSLDEIMRLTYQGNIKVPDGSGIDFSATAGTGTSELFNDYEEGEWTPSFQNYNGTPSGVNAVYTKIGNTVAIHLSATFDGTSDASTFRVTGLPFQPSTECALALGRNTGDVDATVIVNTSSQIRFYDNADAEYSYNGYGASAKFRVTGVYFTAS